MSAVSQTGRRLRLATLEDVPRLVEIGQEMHTQTMFRTISFSREKVEDFLAFCVEDEERLVLVVEEQDTILGGFVGMVSDFYFSNEMLASDLALYVARGHEGAIPIRSILRSFQEWAQERGARRLFVSQSTGTEVGRFTRIFERLGFTISGYNMFKDL